MNCQAISAKCAVLPLIENFMQIRDKGLLSSDKLGKLGPCIFKPVDDFFAETLTKVNIKSVRIKTPMKIHEGQQVVALGDIHGDLLAFLGVMYLMGLVDLRYDDKLNKWTGGNWIGGNTIVVQCGDLLDRSGRSQSVETDNVREEVDLVQYMYYLNKSAQKQGGGVYWVLGNHDFARVWWKNYQGSEITVEDLDQIDRRRHPDYRKYIGNQVYGWGGDTKMKELFSPGGKMAIYMATHSVFTLQVGYYVFMHGGLTLEAINEIYKELNIRDPKYFFGMVNTHVANSFISGIPINFFVRSIVWDRTWSKEKPLKDGEKWEDKKYAITLGRGQLKAEKYCTTNMKKIFKAVDMNWDKGAFVLGHSIQEEGIPLYCDGRVWRIDIGMSEAFSSGKIPKVIGGLKIFMHPHSDRPVEVLVVMNYSSKNNAKYTDRFMLYVTRKFRRLLINKDDSTKFGAYWKRGIIKIIDNEKNLQDKRITGFKRHNTRIL